MSTDRKEEQMDKQTPQGDTPAHDVAPTEETKRELIAALQQNWQREVQGARTYRDLARNESDRAKRAVLEKLAEAETRHAHRWEHKLAE